MFVASKFIVADDHPLFRSALKQAIQHNFKEAEILECENIAELETTAQNNSDADLILLDLHMPGATGFSGLVLIRRLYPDLPVVIVSASEEGHVMQRALDYGASGFIPKSSTVETIGQAIQQVLNGEIWQPEPLSTGSAVSNEERDFAQRLKTLTPQQFRVFMMLTKGLLNKQIADQISVSEATIRTHMTAIFKKLGVRNRTQAVLAAKYLDVDTPNVEDTVE